MDEEDLGEEGGNVHHQQEQRTEPGQGRSQPCDRTDKLKERDEIAELVAGRSIANSLGVRSAPLSSWRTAIVARRERGSRTPRSQQLIGPGFPVPFPSRAICRRAICAAGSVLIGAEALKPGQNL